MDRAIGDRAHAAPGSWDAPFVERAHMRVPTAPARRDGLDIQNIDNQCITRRCPTDLERPRNRVPTPNRWSRQIDELADWVHEHRAASRILRLEDHGRTRGDRQHRWHASIVEVADLVAWDTFDEHSGTPVVHRVTGH